MEKEMKDRTYIAIDLKSFYASVECVERGLDPLTTHLVVADVSRTEKTICLAVSPSLKAYGVPGRARLFEAVQKVREINAGRKEKAPGHILKGRSADETELRENPQLALDYIAATPRMAYYMSLSFISLPTVPELGLTDQGLIDVLGHKKTNLIFEEQRRKKSQVRA